MAISRKKTTTKCLSSKNRIFEWPTKMWVKWKWIMQTQKGDDKHEERRAWWHHHLSDCFVCAPLSLSQQQQQQKKTRWSTCFYRRRSIAIGGMLQTLRLTYKKKIMIIKREVEREPSPTRNKVHCYGIWIFRQPKQQQQQKENSYIIVYAIPPPTPGRNWKELH